MVRFVILAAPRTGSNLLCTLLNSHPGVLCHHEVFNPEGIFTAVTHRDRPLGLGTVEARDRDPLGFLERVWETGRGYRSVGFKWTRGQNETVLRHVVADRLIAKIVLRRRNRIKTLVSERIAQQTNQWEVYHERDLLTDRPRVHLTADSLRRHVAANERFYGDLEAAIGKQDQRHLLVDYEDLFDAEVQSRLVHFIGASPAGAALKAASVKQNPTDLRDLISNFDQLADELRGTPFEAELYEVET